MKKALWFQWETGCLPFYGLDSGWIPFGVLKEKKGKEEKRIEQKRTKKK